MTRVFSFSMKNKVSEWEGGGGVVSEASDDVSATSGDAPSSRNG